MNEPCILHFTERALQTKKETSEKRPAKEANIRCKEPCILCERALHPAFNRKSSADLQKRPRKRDLQKRSMSDEKRLTKEAKTR